MSYEFDGDCFKRLPIELAQIERQLFAISTAIPCRTRNLELMYQCGWSAAVATCQECLSQNPMIDTVSDPARRSPPD